MGRRNKGFCMEDGTSLVGRVSETIVHTRTPLPTGIISDISEFTVKDSAVLKNSLILVQREKITTEFVVVY